MLNRTLNFLNLSKRGLVNIILGAIIMAFTIVNVHDPAQITEGGILGLAILSYKVLDFNPSIMTPILDLLCFTFAFTFFGKNFLKKTAVASLVFSFSYRLFMAIGPIMPSMYNYPLIAAIVGGIGIGVGCGLVVIQGCAAGGDDALVFILSKRFNIGMSKGYLITDIVVLVLSLIYIPFGRIFFSLVTTVVSSIMVGQFEVRKIEKPSLQLTANS
ncbi:MAG: YitT family protein [Tissierellia bacterium]|jgi:uncharacterized membrane-anchored protein YitT (DUF2179 family)|nr:YitT family protein [Tissierellia bacterium]